jgi:cation:H+ antiporter
MVWLELFICVLAILFAGTKLSEYGDAIAERTGLGRSWIGLILLATVTSLPELISGVSAVTLNNLPNIAVGGIIGSCLFNLVILAFLDLAAGKTPLSHRVHHSHIISAGFGIVMLTCVCMAKIFGAGSPRLFGLINLFSFMFLILYAIAIRTIFQYEQKLVSGGAESDAASPQNNSLLRPVGMFILFACVIVAAAVYLPDITNRVGQITGLSNTFLGSSLVAIATSLPEVVVSLSAARIGAFDMAVGNVLGSNLFNVAILAVEDLCYKFGPLIAHSSEQHLMTAMAAIICTAIATVGVTFRAEKKILAMTWDSIAIIVCYVATTWWLFAHP